MIPTRFTAAAIQIEERYVLLQSNSHPAKTGRHTAATHQPIYILLATIPNWALGQCMPMPPAVEPETKP
jgi:hypothetical protein